MYSTFVDVLPGLAGWALKGSVLFGCAWAATVLLRHQSASMRHLVWALAVTGALLLPLLQSIAPRWAAPGLTGLTPVTNPAAAPASSGAALASGDPMDDARPLTTAALPDDRATRVEGARGGAEPVAAPPGSRGPSAVAPRSGQGPLTAWLVVLWLAGAGTVLVGMLAGLVGTALMARGARPVPDGRLATLWNDARRHLGLRRSMRLLVSNDHAMPMTWGAWRPVVLLPAAAATWPTQRVWTVLLHELAHVRRYDFVTQLVARVACAVHWFNPLAWLAARKLREEREHACDDVVLASGARASDYADHLLAIARTLRAAPLPAVAAVAMARPSQLGTRLLAVLDGGRAHAGVGRRGLIGTLAVAALLVLPLAGATAPSATGDAAVLPKFLPTKVQGGPPLAAHAPSAERQAPRAGQPWRAPASQRAALCDWSRRGEHRNSSSMNVDDDHAKIAIVADDCTLDIEYRGEIRYTDDDRDIAAIAPGGYFLIEERFGRERRELELRADRRGGLERKWFVNREERPWGAEAQAWLADVLPFVFRRTGINAEQRAVRILRGRGPDALLEEISLIPSDHVARRYYEVLLAQPDLSTDLVRRVVREAGSRIASDHELGRLLRTIAEKQPMDEAVRIAYVEASGTIASDHEHGRVLRAILARRGVSPELAEAMLRSAKHIDSDHEVGGLLREFLAARPLDEALTPAFFDAFENIDSDHEQRLVLGAALARGAPSRALLDRILEYAGRIGSSHERGRLLRQVAELYPMDGPLPGSYIAAARGIGSDHELGGVLRAIVERGSLSDATVNSLLDAATAIDSDHELGRLLMLLVDKELVRDATRPAFMRALDTIQSEHTRGQVLAKLYPRGRPA